MGTLARTLARLGLAGEERTGTPDPVRPAADRFRHVPKLGGAARTPAARVIIVGDAASQNRGSPDDRDESEAERADRNLGELLQELRVAGLGVQVLFGVLLSLPFTRRFTQLSPGQRNLYLGTIVLAAVATALLLGPVAYHRLVFRQGEKDRLVRAANIMAIAGLAAVGLAVSCAILLVTGYVSGGLTAGLITAFVTLLFAGLWFALPLARRR